MNHELICCWLGLPADSWPPDHYRLLGLEPGESDLSLIEQRVHQRLDLVRRYQVMHPEQATEAMNRLAQAFVCLTEPPQKSAYDAQLLGSKPKPVPPPLPTASTTPVPPPLPPALPVKDPLEWLYDPTANGPGGVPLPPVRVPLPAPPSTVAEVIEEPIELPQPPLPPPSEPVDPIREAAQLSRQARRHLSTRRALFFRVQQTRHLQRLWHRLGNFLNDTSRKLSPREASELYRLIEQIDESTEGFPLLGEAGQPGHLIISLTQYNRSRSLRELDPLLQESLRRDWEGGLKFLEFHRDYLLHEIGEARKRGRMEQLARAVRSWLNEKPAVALLVLLTLLVLGIAAWNHALLGN